jgi:hypothetical protein
MTEREESPQGATREKPLLARWRDHLLVPVDGASLAVFRICFGLILLWEVFRYFRHGWIAAYYIKPQLHFTYLFFSWVKPWPGHGMYAHFVLLGLCAVLMTLGRYYRLAAWGFFLGFSYVFLLDAARYLNHHYLVCLLCFLMAVVPANRVWSLDASFNKCRALDTGTVPRWCVWLLRAQISLVYFYAGVAKLNEDWLLRAEPLRSWLASLDALPLAALLLRVPGGVWLMVYGSTVIDLSVGFLLWWRRTFWPTALVLLLFHALNFYLFRIGIFPWLMLATLTLFPAPDWPRRLWARGQKNEVPGSGISPSTNPHSHARWQMAELVLLHLYLALQLLLPLRHWLYL